jgi:HUS1 checkpoint protein
MKVVALTLKELHILLPPLQKVRTVVERLCPMSDTLTF